MPITSYRDLDVWKQGIQLTLAVYKLTVGFPDEERFGLTSQLRRSAASIPSNIAEGHARISTKEYIRHISIALGSLAELETQLLLAGELGFARKEAIEEQSQKTDRLGKQLRSLMKSLQSKISRTSDF